MKKYIKLFVWIGMIFQFFLVFPVIIGLIALKKVDQAKTKDELRGLAIAVLLLVSLVAGILMLTISNKELDSKINSSFFSSKKMLERTSNAFVYIFLTVLSIIWVIPIFWLVIQSFRAEPGSVQVNFFPRSYTFQNYINLFDPVALAQTSIKFPQWFLNTLIIATVTMVISTIMVLLTSYAFSRLRFGARLPMMQLILILGLFPGFMSMIAVFNILKLLNLTGNIWGLIFIYSGGAGFGYYIAKGYFDTISKAIDEAAMIDGASRSQIFWHIILPLSKPIVIFTALTSFIGPWGDYIFARVILLDNTDSYNVAVGLVWITQRENITQYFTTFLAGSVLVALPITLLFVFMQKYYIEGVTGGSVKG